VPPCDRAAGVHGVRALGCELVDCAAAVPALCNDGIATYTHVSSAPGRLPPTWPATTASKDTADAYRSSAGLAWLRMTAANSRNTEGMFWR